MANLWIHKEILGGVRRASRFPFETPKSRRSQAFLRSDIGANNAVLGSLRERSSGLGTSLGNSAPARGSLRLEESRCRGRSWRIRQPKRLCTDSLAAARYVPRCGNAARSAPSSVCPGCSTTLSTWTPPGTPSETDILTNEVTPPATQHGILRDPESGQTRRTLPPRRCARHRLRRTWAW